MLYKDRLLGIIGGMGTQATACFYEILHSLQSVASEQEYLDVLLYSKPSIPDRTAYITGQSTNSPFEHLVHAAQKLETAGASCIVVPCATSHFFYADLVKTVNIPILNMLEATALYIKECGIRNVCLLATDGTLKGGYFHKAFEKYSIAVTVPSDGLQADLMEMIYDIKRGEAVSADALIPIISQARIDGAEAVVLGCTELCVIASNKWNKADTHSVIQNLDMINTLEVLAEASLSFFKD
jgi:aspartate racemase